MAIPGKSAPADIVAGNIVLLGSFDPLLLQPSYLSDHGLLTEGDLAQLRYQFLTSDFTGLKLDWMRVILEPNRLFASTTPESPIVEPVRDFVFALYETFAVKSVTAVGLNHDTHFPVSSEEVLHSVGHQLAPKEVWREVVKQPGMASLTIRGQRSDDFAGHISVKIEPSARVSPGVFVNINDHMAIGELDSDRLVAAAGERFAASKKHSDEIVAALKGIAR